MHPQRLPYFFSLLLLVSAVFFRHVSVNAEPADESFPNELNTDHEEPQIDLPEHKTDSKFRLAARTERKPSPDKLVELCKSAVDTTSRRLLSTEQHTPWQIMHGLLGLRQQFQILHEGEPISGLDWVAQGQVFDNEFWFEKTRFGGRAHPYSRPYAFEGHANQFLAILSMCGLDLDHSFGTSDDEITMRDMIRHAQMTVTARDEPTWTLWALSRYLPSTASWRSSAGEPWSIEKLVQIQTAKPMRGAPCGGTHGLFALAHARNVYLRGGKRLRGIWLQAEYKIRKYINTARMQQNSNGTLSSNFFRGREYNPDFNKRMASAGHILEFLMIALPQKELNQLWVRRAIEATARDLLNNRKAYVKCSPLYHSVNALSIYLDRVNPHVPVKDVAKSEDETKTATVPRPADADGGLKAVPVSQGKTLQSTPDATGDSDDDEHKTPVPGDVGPQKNASSDPAPDRKGSSEGDTEAPNKSAGEQGWKATPPERRGPIRRMTPEDSTEKKTTQESMEDSKGNGEEESDELYPPEPRDSSVDDQEPASEKSDDAESPKANGDSAQPTDKAPAAGKEPAESETSDSSGNASDNAGDKETEPESGSAEKPAGDPQGDADASDDKADTAANEADSDADAAADAAEVDADAAADDADVDADAGEQAADGTSDVNPEAQGSDGKESPPENAEESTSEPAKEEPAQEKKTADLTSIEVPRGINRQFLDPNLRVNNWLERFETESREIFAARRAITEASGLQEGMSIADVGAGTGLFVGLFSRAVGDSGRVFAIDISPRFVDFLDRRINAEGLTNVQVVRNDERSLMLGLQKVDRVFVCDTYHHFEHHREMLDSIFSSLHPGGEMILVDFERIPGTSREWVLNHVRGGKQQFRDEIVRAGFQYVEEVAIPEFQENYLLRFRKPTED